jgi:hypothetical protein
MPLENVEGSSLNGSMSGLDVSLAIDFCKYGVVQSIWNNCKKSSTPAPVPEPANESVSEV